MRTALQLLVWSAWVALAVSIGKLILIGLFDGPLTAAEYRALVVGALPGLGITILAIWVVLGLPCFAFSLSQRWELRWTSKDRAAARKEAARQFLRQTTPGQPPKN